MAKENLLLTLLIHRRSKKKYYLDHEKYVDKQKRSLESSYRMPFESLDKDRQSYFMSLWFWSPWRFNDIVGYAEIVLENAWTVIGHLYLPEGRFSPARKKPIDLQYGIASADFEEGSEDSLKEAIIEVIEQLELHVKERKWVLEYDEIVIKHTDFLKIVGERSRNAPN